MKIPEKYFHDRSVLLLITVSCFLAVLNTVVILLKLDSSRSDSYIVQYRANLGLSAFTAGGSSAFLGFILFSVIVLVLHTILSMRVYSFHRQFSLVILSLTVLLLVLALIISNALLALR